MSRGSASPRPRSLHASRVGARVLRWCDGRGRSSGWHQANPDRRSDDEPDPSTRTVLSLFCAVLVAVAIVSATASGGVARRSHSPVVTTDSGAVRGLAAGGGYAFRGLPYAAPPTGELRWRPPQRARVMEGRPRRDAVRAELPADSASPFAPPGPSVRGLPVPERLHADAAPRREPAGARVDPRRRLHPGRRPQLRRHEARGGRHRSSSRSTTGSARSASSRTRRSPRGPAARPATTA